MAAAAAAGAGVRSVGHCVYELGLLVNRLCGWVWRRRRPGQVLRAALSRLGTGST